MIDSIETDLANAADSAELARVSDEAIVPTPSAVAEGSAAVAASVAESIARSSLGVSLETSNELALMPGMMSGRTTAAQRAANRALTFAAVSDLEGAVFFMSRRSLISRLLRFKQALLRAETQSSDRYGYLIEQVERLIIDIRVMRVDDVDLPGTRDARVHMLPD